MTLTAKIMYELIKFYAGKPLETLQKMQQGLRPGEVRAQIRGGDIEFFRANPLFQGMPNTDGLKVKGTLIYLLDRIIASREGDEAVAAPFRPDAPVAVPLADVPDRLVKRLGTPPLLPGIDPIPPYQEAYGIVRNEDGMSIVHRDPALGFRKFVRATPKPAAGQAWSRSSTPAPPTTSSTGSRRIRSTCWETRTTMCWGTRRSGRSCCSPRRRSRKDASPSANW